MMSTATAGIISAFSHDRVDETSRTSETTRYLAAAAHYDDAFRDAVLEQIHHARYRCKAPEFGIDGDAVIAECLKSRRRVNVRNAFLLAGAILLLVATDILGDLAFVAEAPDFLGLFFEYYAVELLALWGFGAAVLFGHRLLGEHFTLRRRFNAARHPSAAGPQARRHPSRQNLVVYGGYLPFVGSGLALRDWSFSVNLHKTIPERADAHEADGISVDDLVEVIRTRLAALEIPGLDQHRILFADGRYIREDRRLMPSPYTLPPAEIPQELVHDEAETEKETCRRSYWCISVTDWNGDMVMTTYLRFKKGESHLFAEASHFILPPLKPAYYSLDTMVPALRVKRVLHLAGASLLKAPFLILASPFLVYAFLLQPVRRWFEARRTRRAIRDNPRFNYGALTTIRQIGMENQFRVYFQKLDRDMHLKTIEQCLIDSILQYLEEHNIDTSDIRERRSAILNNGVLISGGVVNSDSITAGAGAKSIVSKVKSAAVAATGPRAA